MREVKPRQHILSMLPRIDPQTSLTGKGKEVKSVNQSLWGGSNHPEITIPTSAPLSSERPLYAANDSCSIWSKTDMKARRETKEEQKRRRWQTDAWVKRKEWLRRARNQIEVRMMVLADSGQRDRGESATGLQKQICCSLCGIKCLHWSLAKLTAKEGSEGGRMWLMKRNKLGRWSEEGKERERSEKRAPS